jgi:hypothetical protein
MTVCAMVLNHGQSIHHGNRRGRTQRAGARAAVLLGVGYRLVKAGVPAIIVQHLLVRNLVERDKATHLVLTEQRRAVLAALVMPP